MKLVNLVWGAALAISLGASTVWAQTTAEKNDAKPAEKKDSYSGRPMDNRPMKTFYLANASQPNDGNEILTALRLLLDPGDKLYLTPSQNAVTMRADEDQLASAQRIIAELDRPKKLYRLTYTITEKDGGKTIGSQHFSMDVAAGMRCILKQGSKVPIVTGSYNEGKNGTEHQVTYLDIGLNFDATLVPLANGVSLKSQVEQSSVAEEKSGVGTEDPIVRQTVLEGTSQLALGKPLVLGALDVTGSTRHLDVEALVELVK